jgi:peptidoglycan/LPS O-acetylase OafA/YrhL
MPTRPSTSTSFVDHENPGGLRHIPALDGLRGLAILLVLGDHLLWANSQTSSSIFNLITYVRESLWIGVNLFFALSGFLITGILSDNLHDGHFFRNFYARRALRIFPLYYGVLFVLLALTRFLHFEWNHWQYFYLTYTSNLALIGMSGLGLPHVNINHFWSLQVEEQFYLIWPFVVYRFRHKLRLIAGTFVVCLVVLAIRSALVLYSAHLTNQYLTMSPTFSCVDNLLFGCILALFLRTKHRQRVLDLVPKIFAVCLVCIIAMAVTDRGLNYFDSPIQQTLGESLLGIGSAALIGMCIVQGSRTGRVFSSPFLRFFGKYSYGIYVFHYTLHLNLTGPFREFIGRHTHSHALAVAGGAVAVTALSILVALLSYHFYEKHFLKLKRFFPYAPKSVRAFEP